MGSWTFAGAENSQTQSTNTQTNQGLINAVQMGFFFYVFEVLIFLNPHLQQHAVVNLLLLIYIYFDLKEI